MNTPFRFVHTADLHLDSPLRSLALRDTALASRVDGATRTALQRIVDLCIDEKVHALLIAGDLYDGEQKSMHTAARLGTEMRRLRDADIPVLMIRGNHDAAATITRNLTLPENVHVFDGRGGTRLLASQRVAIHGVSFKQRTSPESLLPKYPAPLEGCINIGLMHTSLGGSVGHDVYAPCSPAELIAHGYDYWGLGHIHKRQVIGTQPCIVMPGNPQGRDIGEDGQRSVTLVSIDDDHRIQLDTRIVGPVQFERLPIDVASLDTYEALPDRFRQALQSCREQVQADELVARLEIVGATPFAFRLLRDTDFLLETAREAALAVGECWIEAVDVRRVQRQLADTPATAGDQARLGELIDEALLQSPALQNQILQEADELIRKLPQDLKHAFGDTEESRQALLQQLTREGSDLMLAAISGED